MANWFTQIGAAIEGFAGYADRVGVPKQAEITGNMERWWSPWGGGGPSTSAGISVDETRAMQISTIFACSRAIAEPMGSLPGIVYEELSEAERRRARGTRQWSLLHDCPNDQMDSFQFFELQTLRLTNQGAAISEIERNNFDEPINLWPIHPSRATPYKTNSGELWWDIKIGDTETGRRTGKSSYKLPGRDVLNVVNFLSNDGVTSRGVLSYAKEEAGVAIATQQYEGSWFANGARPSGLVKHPTFINDPVQQNVFRSDINKIYGQGGWNRVGVLWGGADWHSLQMSPDDVKSVETRSYGDKAICRFYNVPPAVVQIFEDYKFATVDAMIRQYVLTCLRAYAVRWEKAIKTQILSRRDENGQLRSAFRDGEFLFEFLLNALLRGDPKTQAEANAILRQWGVLNADEWRAQENYNPIGGAAGTAYIVPSNYTTAERMVAGTVEGGGGRGGGNAIGQRLLTTRPKWEKAFAAAMLTLVTKGEDRAVRQANEAAVERIEIPATPSTDQPNDQPNDSKTTDPAALELNSFAFSVLCEAAGRMIAAEQIAMRRAASKPSEFLSKVDEFYVRHVDRMAEAIAMGVRGILQVPWNFSVQAEATRIAMLHCHQSREAMLFAAECPANGLAASVELGIEFWPDRAKTLHQLLTRTNEATNEAA